MAQSPLRDTFTDAIQAVNALADDLKTLLFLKTPRTCTELGEYLWGGRRNRQCYARPAGRIIQRLVREERVRRVYPAGWQKRSPLYQATEDPLALEDEIIDAADCIFCCVKEDFMHPSWDPAYAVEVKIPIADLRRLQRVMKRAERMRRTRRGIERRRSSASAGGDHRRGDPGPGRRRKADRR